MGRTLVGIQSSEMWRLGNKLDDTNTAHYFKSSCMQIGKAGGRKLLMRRSSDVERKETMECFSDVTCRIYNFSCRFESYHGN